jgi:DNA-binding SARP family transcriptional activator
MLRFLVDGAFDGQVSATVLAARRVVGQTAGLRVSLLGELAASYDGTRLDLGGPRQRAVLALLVIARGEVVLAESLADWLWGSTPPANAAATLQSYVSHLRRRLEPGSRARNRGSVIVSRGQGYGVSLPDDAVDAWEFERLVRRADAEPEESALETLCDALALWQGPALTDYRDEPWAQPEITRLTELRAVARERRAGVRLELGECALVVPELEALVAEEPLREERWRLLVLGLYRAHRQADALAALRRARATLADELGVDPGPALRQLEADVLAQSPSLELPRQRTRSTVAAVRGDEPGDLAERESEVAALTAAVDAVVAGEPRLVLVEGPAGIGKTRLLAEARRLATDRSVTTLAARGIQLEQDYAFGAVRQLFEPELAGADGAGLLDGPAAPARVVFDVTQTEPGEGSLPVLHALYLLTLQVCARGPVLVLVDDLQWWDRASVRFLAYLTRRLDGRPVGIVGAVRTGEEHLVADLLGPLTSEPSATVLRPEPLTESAVDAIVSRRLGPAAPLFVTACHRTTSGNPLLLGQLVTALESTGVAPDASHADLVVAVGSRAVSKMVLLRMRRMPEDVVAVARTAAVLGDGAALPTVAALAGRPEAETAAALAALARADVVRDEHPLAFVHPLVREAVYLDVPAVERGLRHEQAADLLRAAGAADDQVAAHLLLAPPRGDVGRVVVLRSAAWRAAARGAVDSAATYLRRALAEPPPPQERSDLEGALAELEAEPSQVGRKSAPAASDRPDRRTSQ